MHLIVIDKINRGICTVDRTSNTVTLVMFAGITVATLWALLFWMTTNPLWYSPAEGNIPDSVWLLLGMIAWGTMLLRK